MKKLFKWLRQSAEVVIALVLGSMFVTFLIQIVFRYLLSLPLGWTIEYVAIAWLWGILFGYAFVVRDYDIIRLDIVYSAVPAGLRRVFDVITNFFAAAILIWSLPKAYEYVQFMAIERTAYIRIPFNIVFAIYVPFIITIVIRMVLNGWHAITGRNDVAETGRTAGADEHV